MQWREFFRTLARATAVWPILAITEPAQPAIGVLFPGAPTVRLGRSFLAKRNLS